MKCVILCAGKSTRTYPLTVDRPKPLLKVVNKPLLEWSLESLQGLVDEAILVVGFGKDMIKKKIGSKYGNLRIKYVEQKEAKGTGHALLQAEGSVKEKFLVMMGDDFYQKSDIETCLKNDFSLLAKEAENPEDFGILETRGENLVKIVEKPEKPRSRLINAGLYVLDDMIFGVLKETKTSAREELELTDAINRIAKGIEFKVVKTDKCFMITYPWNLLELNEYLLSKIRRRILVRVERGVFIKGNVVIGKNTLVKSGAYIEGPVVIGDNCVIGPNCYIRRFCSIGNGCKIGNGVEVKNSILMDNVTIGHLSYIGDSIIDENVNFGAGTKVANLRHDEAGVKSMVKGKLVDTGRRKFGTVTGHDVHTGINTSVYPGRKLWPNTTTLPGEVVKYDKEQ